MQGRSLVKARPDGCRRAGGLGPPLAVSFGGRSGLRIRTGLWPRLGTSPERPGPAPLNFLPVRFRPNREATGSRLASVPVGAGRNPR